MYATSSARYVQTLSVLIYSGLLCTQEEGYAGMNPVLCFVIIKQYNIKGKRQREREREREREGRGEREREGKLCVCGGWGAESNRVTKINIYLFGQLRALCPGCRHAPQSHGLLVGGPSLVLVVEFAEEEGVETVAEVLEVVILVEGMEAVI